MEIDLSVQEIDFLKSEYINSYREWYHSYTGESGEKTVILNGILRKILPDDAYMDIEKREILIRSSGPK